MESLGCTVETNTGLPRWLRGKNQSAMQETRVQSLGQEDPLEEGMATHSSILAWRIPWAEEPGELLSIGSKRVGHDWSDWAHTQKLTEHCKSTLLQENKFTKEKWNPGNLRTFLQNSKCRRQWSNVQDCGQTTLCMLSLWWRSENMVPHSLWKEKKCFNAYYRQPRIE